MTELHDQPTPPYGTDRWGEPILCDSITTGSYVLMPQPGQKPGERDVFQVAFVSGRPGARDEMVAFGWRHDAAAGEWKPWWQSVGPGSVPTPRVTDREQQPPLTPCTCRQTIHAHEHTTPIDGCPWCMPAPEIRPKPVPGVETVQTGDAL